MEPQSSYSEIPMTPRTTPATLMQLKEHLMARAQQSDQTIGVDEFGEITLVPRYPPEGAEHPHLTLPNEDQKEWGRLVKDTLKIAAESLDQVRQDMRDALQAEQRAERMKQEAEELHERVLKEKRQWSQFKRNRNRRIRRKRSGPHRRQKVVDCRNFPAWQPGEGPIGYGSPTASRTGLPRELVSTNLPNYVSWPPATSPMFPRSTTVWKDSLPMQQSLMNWRDVVGSLSVSSNGRGRGTRDFLCNGAMAALFAFLLLAGQAQAATTPETLLFESIGEMVAGLSYSHTVVTVPLGELEQQVIDYRTTLTKEFRQDQLMDTLNQVFANASNSSDFDLKVPTVFKKWSRIGAIHLAEVDALRTRVDHLFDLVPPTQKTMEDRVTSAFQAPPIATPEGEWSSQGSKLERRYEDFFKRPLGKREKRALPLVALGGAGLLFGGAGTLFGWLGIKGTTRLQQQLSIIQRNQDAIIKAAFETDKKLEVVRQELQDLLLASAISDHFDPTVLLARLRTYTSQLESKVSKHERLLQELQHQKLAVDFLDARSLNQLFHQAKKRAKSLGFNLLLQRPADVFQIKASHFFNSQGQVLSIVLHLPIAPEDSFMRLFRLHPFPLPFSNDTFIIPDVSNDILAVSNSNFRYTSQMSSVDLIGCLKINRLYLCERNGVLQKHPEDSCLGALYHQKFDLAKRICSFRVEPAREFIHQLMDNWFLIHLMEPTTVPVLCSNNTHLEWHLKPGVTRQHLGAGCVADFPRHRLLSDVSILVPQDYIQFDMDWDPVTFLPEVREFVLPEFKKLERLGATNVALSTLQSLVTNNLDNPPFFHNIHFAFNTIAIATSLALLALGLHRCRLLQQERRRLRRERRLQEAVRTAMSINGTKCEEDGPRYATPGPGSRRYSLLESSNQQLYPKPTAP